MSELNLAPVRERLDRHAVEGGWGTLADIAQDVPSLVDEVERLRSLVTSLQGQVNAMDLRLTRYTGRGRVIRAGRRSTAGRVPVPDRSPLDGVDDL